MTIGERIKHFRELKGLSQTELATAVNISKQTLYKYENNIITNIPSDKIEAIAKKCDTKPQILMGWNETENKSNDNLNPLPKENIYMRPLFNSVAAGFGAVAENTIVSYIPTYIKNPIEQEQYIWISVQGDSMSPLIDDGCDILIKKQDSVDSGQIGVVLIDGDDAVVKKINYGKNWIELISINPYYPPRRFEGADIQRVRVLGLVKKVSKELQ